MTILDKRKRCLHWGRRGWKNTQCWLIVTRRSLNRKHFMFDIQLAAKNLSKPTCFSWVNIDCCDPLKSKITIRILTITLRQYKEGKEYLLIITGHYCNVTDYLNKRYDSQKFNYSILNSNSYCWCVSSPLDAQFIWIPSNYKSFVLMPSIMGVHYFEGQVGFKRSHSISSTCRA